MVNKKFVLSGTYILTGMCFSLLPSVAFADVPVPPEVDREVSLSHFESLVLSWLGLIGVLILIALFVTVLVRYGMYRYRKFNLMDVSYAENCDTHWFSKVCTSLGSLVISIVGLIVVLYFVLSPVHLEYNAKRSNFTSGSGETVCDSRMVTPMTALVRLTDTVKNGVFLPRSTYAYVTVFDHIRYRFFSQIRIEDVRNDAIGGVVLEKECMSLGLRESCWYEEHSDFWFLEQ